MRTPEEFLKEQQIEDCELQVGNVVLLSYPPQVPVKKLSQLLTDFASQSKPEEIEFVKSKDQDGDDLISWKTLSGLYNIIIHNESIGVSFIPFDSNQKSQLIHHDFTRNTKTVDAVDELTKLRNELFDKMPTGEVSAFALIRVIQNHLNKLDKYIESKK